MDIVVPIESQKYKEFV